MDDEYFRLAITVRSDLEAHPIVQQLAKATITSLDRLEAAGFKEQFLQSVRIDAADGPDFELNARFRLDFERLHHVAAQIVRGLHYYESTKLMPLTWPVNAFCDNCFAFDEMQSIFPLDSILRALWSEPSRVVQPSVFEYQYTFFPERPDSYVWKLTLFEKAWILAFVNCPEVQQKVAERQNCRQNQ